MRRGILVVGRALALALPAIAAAIAAAMAPAAANAGDVEIVRAVLARDGTGAWQVDVTLRHGDTGWDHYADAWRIVAEDGTVLGTRTLFHPHENEQPFTRGLGGVTVPSGAAKVRVEAHDKVHGWSPDSIAIDLSVAKGERYEVRR